MQHILLTKCLDQSGLIANITQACLKYNLNIIKNNEFVDTQSKTFFMRTVLESEETIEEKMFLFDLKKDLPNGAECQLASTQAKRIIILATKEAHCLGDLLMKHYNGVLNIEIAAVVSNYNTLSSLCKKFNVPFHYVDHQKISRETHEQHMTDIMLPYQADYVVLAKYMRILSQSFISNFSNKMINIHHSFLPAFIGAAPYKQAFDRGVKMIGATAHFVTEELDQGPIIQQDVIQVDHSYQPEKLAQAGQQLEESVLLKALQLVIANKVFVQGNRTVVFP